VTNLNGVNTIGIEKKLHKKSLDNKDQRSQVKTTNTLDCDQSNVAYSSRELVSPNLLFRSFSLYPAPVRNKCPISYHVRQQSLESKGKVWSVSIHKVNRNG